MFCIIDLDLANPAPTFIGSTHPCPTFFTSCPNAPAPPFTASHQSLKAASLCNPAFSKAIEKDLKSPCIADPSCTFFASLIACSATNPSDLSSAYTDALIKFFVNSLRFIALLHFRTLYLGGMFFFASYLTLKSSFLAPPNSTSFMISPT